MLTLTQEAVRKVRELETENGVEGQHLRLFVQSGGCSGFEYGMKFDNARDDDARVESENVVVLVDPASMERIKGSTIHFDDGLHGKGFEIRNPNAASTCGCGRSFS